MTRTPQPGDWGDQNTDVFIDIGRYAVPEREWQIAMFCDLIPPRSTPFTIVELCCGEGLLAEALLARFPYANLLALDGSPAMLERTARRLDSYAGRASTRQFDLADYEWRAGIRNAAAVVSSLAIHHLDDAQKQRLFRDVYAMLEPGGVAVRSRASTQARGKLQSAPSRPVQALPAPVPPAPAPGQGGR